MFQVGSLLSLQPALKPKTSTPPAGLHRCINTTEEEENGAFEASGSWRGILTRREQRSAAITARSAVTARRALFLNDDPKHKQQQHMPPPSLSLSVCLHVSRPLSPGEAAPNQRCDLFIRRLQTRPRRRHERPRLVLVNCLICLSGETPDPPPHYPSATSLTPSSPVSPTAAPTRGELVCDKLRANSGALLAIAAGRCVCRLSRCRPLSSPSPSSFFFFQSFKTLLPTRRSKSSGRKRTRGKEAALKGKREA